MPFPQLARVRRTFDARHLDDVAGTVRRELERTPPAVPPGASIAIAVGRRGIRDFRAIVQETVRFLKTRGAAPFIVLVMDEMGKDVSGIGLEPALIGRMRVTGVEEPRTSSIKVIVVTDLTDASHGNALGVRLADIITRRLQRKIDPAATTENAVTSTFLERAKLPLGAETDRPALEFALRCCLTEEGTEPRVVRIRNTLRLDERYVSRAVLDEMRGRETFEELGGFEDALDASGALVPFGG